MSKTDELEAKIKELESKKKDVWDLVSIISSFLVPVSIFLGSWWISQKEQKQKDLELQISQADLVQKFIEPLSSKDPLQRKMAVEAVVIAFEDTARIAKILNMVKRTDPDSIIQTLAAAQEVKQQTPGKLDNYLKLIFDQDRDRRRGATALIIQEYKGDTTLIPRLLDAGKKHLGDNDRGSTSGTVNTLVILKALNKEDLVAEKVKIQAFIASVKQKPDRKQATQHAEELEKLLQ